VGKILKGAHLAQNKNTKISEEKKTVFFVKKDEERDLFR
jgi:hypothetical protein